MKHLTVEEIQALGEASKAAYEFSDIDLITTLAEHLGCSIPEAIEFANTYIKPFYL